MASTNLPQIQSETIRVGDTVRVLRACRLPDIEEVIAVGKVLRIGESPVIGVLYWVDGVLCARPRNLLRKVDGAHV